MPASGISPASSPPWPRRDEGLHRTFYTLVLIPCARPTRPWLRQSHLPAEDRARDHRRSAEGKSRRGYALRARGHPMSHGNIASSTTKPISISSGASPPRKASGSSSPPAENGQNQVTFIDMAVIVPKLKDMPELEYNANPGGVAKGVFCPQLHLPRAPAGDELHPARAAVHQSGVQPGASRRPPGR